MKINHTMVFSILIICLPLLITSQTEAAESAFSHYLPGVAGDIAIAQSPKPGLQVANAAWIQAGSVSRAVLQGKVDLDLDNTTVLDIASAAYTIEVPILKGTYTAALGIPFGYANLDAQIKGPKGGIIPASENAFELSDIFFVPIQLNWSLDKLSFKFAHAVVAPTGSYSINDLVNLGRNYWSFDTVGAVTWFNTETGTEASIAPGIMVNTKNNATDYQTGAEFHVDFTLNQFLTETFSVGLRGYYYRQVTGDSGNGALLGDFMSESLGIGPGFYWSPKATNGQFVMLGKWIHDVRTRNRFDSEYGMLTVAWTF